MAFQFSMAWEPRRGYQLTYIFPILLPSSPPHEEVKTTPPEPHIHSPCHAGALLGSSRIARECLKPLQAELHLAEVGGQRGYGSVQPDCASWAADSEILLTCPVLCPSIWAVKPIPSLSDSVRKHSQAGSSVHPLKLG